MRRHAFPVLIALAMLGLTAGCSASTGPTVQQRNNETDIANQKQLDDYVESARKKSEALVTKAAIERGASTDHAVCQTVSNTYAYNSAGNATGSVAFQCVAVTGTISDGTEIGYRYDVTVDATGQAIATRTN